MSIQNTGVREYVADFEESSDEDDNEDIEDGVMKELWNEEETSDEDNDVTENENEESSIEDEEKLSEKEKKQVNTDVSVSFIILHLAGFVLSCKDYSL